MWYVELRFASSRRREASTESWASTRPTQERGEEEGRGPKSRLFTASPQLARSVPGAPAGGSGGEMADWDGVPARERRQMEEILQLDMEELNVEMVDTEEEEVDEDDGEGSFTSTDAFLRDNDGEGVASTSGPFTFNTSLASLHTYLGEVDDTRGRVSLLDGGAILSLPMLYLQGVVLFPGATLPLRVIQDRFLATVEKALRQVDAPCTIGVVLMYRRQSRHYANASVGTTAEIRQLGRMDDGSLNVVARGQQRFRLMRHWMDADGVVWGDVQIIEEDTPLRTPRDAFAQLASCNSLWRHTSAPIISLGVSPIKQHNRMDSELDCGTPSPKSTASNHSALDSRMCNSDSQSSSSMRSSNDDGVFMHEQFASHEVHPLKGDCAAVQSGENTTADEENFCLTPLRSLSSSRTRDTKQQHQYILSKQPFQAPLSFWPRWAYEMYDSYALARRAADLWRQIITNPSMDDFVRKPDLLSFSIGSKLPVSESVRQKVLEIDGISYRLRREIQLLKAFNLIKCRCCKSLIAKRSDMVVMSTDGPLGAYVNPHGFVHETITVSRATGLALDGNPSTVHSWFPGYSWTIAACAECESNIGWLFKATKKNLRPRSFWGIRSTQIADDVQEQDQDE
uniref:Protein cereblon n=1 Tax=Leersia perrieri TaxID=77586 RepID=A0A0D9WIT7_9ORYZ